MKKHLLGGFLKVSAQAVTLYDHPASVIAWQRVGLANYIGTDGFT